MAYPRTDVKPSEFFIDALNGGGSSSVYCACGRQHYAPENLLASSDEDDYKSMLEDVTEEKRKDPDGVVIHTDTDFVYAKDIDNRTFVVDCPCNGLRKYEDWIWNNKDVIRDYLKDRIEQEYRWAEEQLTLNKLAGIK